MKGLPSSLRRRFAFAISMFALGACASFGQEATETPTMTPTASRTPVALDFDPDLDGSGAIDPLDLLLMVKAWQLRDFIAPTPTPPFAPLLGFVVSAQTNLGVASATLVAGSDFALTSPTNGFFRLENVRTDVDRLIVHKDGFQTLEREISHPFPNLILSLFPNDFPTFTPTPSATPTHTPTSTPPPATTQTPSPTPTPTPTGAAVPTGTQPHTSTATATFTRTPTFTPTPSRTPTPVPIAGSWNGKLNGTILVGSNVIWTVHNGFQATAFARQLEYVGIYFFLNSSRVRFDGVSGSETILMEMSWNGADRFTDGQYSITFPDPGGGGGSLTDFGTFALDRAP